MPEAEGHNSRALEAAGCLQDHQLRSTRLLKPSEKRVDALRVVGNRGVFAGRAHGHIQARL